MTPASDRQPTIAEPAWSLLRRFIVRSAGFPFEWLGQLRFCRSATLAQRIYAATARQQELRRAFETAIFPQLCDAEMAAARDKTVFRFWYRLARMIRRGQSLDSELIAAAGEQYGYPALADWLHGWQALCVELSGLYAEGETVFQAELAERRCALREFVYTPRFQEAIWLSNPAIYEVGWQYYHRHWEAQRRPYKIKHLERRFYTYLQRFCAKNDTTSFFGPLNYGSFDEGEATICRRSATPIRRRQVFLAYWAAVTIAERMAAEPSLRPYLRPRRDPSRYRPPADADAATLCASIDGKRTVIDLMHASSRSLEDVLAILNRLNADGLIHLDLPIPPAVLHPLGYLTDWLRTLPDDCRGRARWSAALAEIQHISQQFTGADLPARQQLLAQLEAHYAALTNSDIRRGEGKMFQDRVLLYEECQGNIEQLSFRAAHYAQISAALSPIARFCASYSMSQLHSLWAAAHSVLDEISPAGRPVPFAAFIAAWHRRYPGGPPAPEAEQLHQRFADLVAQNQTEHVSRLTAQDLLPLCAPCAEALLLSPDIMLAAPDLQALDRGAYQLVIGEIHHGAQPVGWMLGFADDREGWERDVAELLPHPTASCIPANLIFKRRMKTAPPEFDGPSVQVSGIAQHSDTIDLSQLVVERHGAEVRLRCAGEARSVRFYPPCYGVPSGPYGPFACFSYPLVEQVRVRLGTHTPRIEIDGVVYQRERWDLPTSELPGRDLQGTSFRLLVEYAEFQHRLGLPDHLFVQTPAEPKPVYIDMRNYFALELLAHLAGQAEMISLVEMCPGPEQLWLEDADGHYCCELRTVFSAA